MSDVLAQCELNPAASFSAFSDHWSPKVAGPFHWHYHELENELFLVARDRVRMDFRDRIVDLDPGKFIIVPHGVAHCPEALTDE